MIGISLGIYSFGGFPQQLTNNIPLPDNPQSPMTSVANSDFWKEQINPDLQAELINRGLPPEYADFFAAAKTEVTSFNNTFLNYMETYPDDSTREVKISLIPDQEIFLTPEEILEAQKIGINTYRINFTNEESPTGPHTRLEFFVPYESMSHDLREQIRAPGSAIVPTFLEPTVQYAFAQGGGSDGAAVTVDSTVQESVEQSLGQLAELAGRGQGFMAMISAMLDLMQAADLSAETFAYYDRLDALSRCAQNPTHDVPVSQSEKDRTQSQLDNIRINLKFVTAMRFLGNMADAPLGFAGPVGAAVSVAIKPIATEADQAMKGFIENTLMKEAKDAVVPCEQAAIGLNGSIQYRVSKKLFEGCTTGGVDICYVEKEERSGSGTFFLTTSGSAISGSGTGTYDQTRTRVITKTPVHPLSEYNGEYNLVISGDAQIKVEGAQSPIVRFSVGGGGYLTEEGTSTRYVANYGDTKAKAVVDEIHRDTTAGFVCYFEGVDLVKGGKYEVDVVWGGVVAGSCEIELFPQ